MILLLWKPMTAIGGPISWKECLVMTWAGLRGAVSLALAIIVDIDPGIDKKTGSLVMFHVGGVAALTFVVNATTCASLLRQLGLTKRSAMHEQVLDQLSHHMSA